MKCIRGDKTDNIPSAYPRVLLRTLQKAFRDEVLMQQVMNIQLNDGQTVQALYERNRQLIDLTLMPQHLLQQLQAQFQTRLSKPIA